MRQGPASSPSRSNAPDWILLAAGGFIAYGGRTLFALGFAHDDWVLLRHMARAASLRERMAGLISGAPAIVFRPAEIPHFAVLHRLFGAAPLGWQGAALALQVALAGAFMGLLRRQGAGRGASLSGALLLLAWPAKDASAFWPIASVCAASAALTLSALNLHWDYVRRGGAWRRAASTACYLGALAIYEQPLFLFPMWLLVPAKDGEKPRRAGGFLWAAAAAVACAAYQRLLAPWLFSMAHNKETSFRLGHAAWVYLAGINANLGPKQLIFCARTAAGVLIARPLLSAAALALAASSRMRGASAPEEPAPRSLIAWGAAFAALAYAPLVFSSYSPVPLDHTNRLNLLPAAGLVAALAGLSGLRRRGAGALAAAAAAALLVHAGCAGIWAESYRRQLAIKAALTAGADRLKGASGLLLRLPERYVAGKAPVFDAHWDIAAALSLWTGLDMTADVVRPETRFEAGVVSRPEGPSLPRRGLYFLDMTRGTLAPFDDFRGDASDPSPKPSRWR